MSRLWVNGMGIFLTALIVEVAVVSAGSHALVCHVQYGLQFRSVQSSFFSGFRDTNLPRYAFLADAAGGYLAANLDHIVLDAFVSK